MRGRGEGWGSAKARELKSVNRLHVTMWKGTVELEGGPDHRAAVFAGVLGQVDWESGLRVTSPSSLLSITGLIVGGTGLGGFVRAGAAGRSGHLYGCLCAPG